MIVSGIVDSEYGKLETEESAYVRAQILYNIIRIKSENPHLAALHQSLYLDVKRFIENYANSVNNLGYGYDHFNMKILFEFYTYLQTSEAISINKYLSRVLKFNGYDDEMELCKLEGYKLDIRYCKESRKVSYLFKFLLFHSTRNLKCLLISTAIILGFYFFILLPAPHSSLVLFNISYDKYCDQFVANHILNLIAGSLDLSKNFQINPLNILGIITLILGKIVLIVLVGNYILQEIVKKLTD